MAAADGMMPLTTGLEWLALLTGLLGFAIGATVTGMMVYHAPAEDLAHSCGGMLGCFGRSSAFFWA